MPRFGCGASKLAASQIPACMDLIQDLNPKHQGNYNARTSRRIFWQLPWKVLAIQAGGCAVASLVLLVFDLALGFSVLLGGVVMLVPGAWFARQITREEAAQTAVPEGAQDAVEQVAQRQKLAVGLAPETMARAYLWQAGVRFLATLVLMGIVIVGYEALNPLGFFASLIGLVLVHFVVALYHSIRANRG